MFISTLEKGTWNQLSGQSKLNYSLTTTGLLPTPTEAKVKTAGARQWVLGMREAADQLHRENEGYEHMVEREAALLEVADNMGQKSRRTWRNWWPSRSDMRRDLAGGYPPQNKPQGPRS